jgi:hypothetical protein
MTAFSELSEQGLQISQITVADDDQKRAKEVKTGGEHVPDPQLPTLRMSEVA